MPPTPTSTDAPRDDLLTFRAPSSAIRACLVLVAQSFQRHWRVRQMGWVSLGLLAVCVTAVSVVTAADRWGLPNRPVGRPRQTYKTYAERLLPPNRYEFSANQYETPSPFDPLKDSLQSLALSIPYAVMRCPEFLADWALMNFSRWVIVVLFLGFILPLFTLSYASGAIGTERESRSLVWLMTRPIPRSMIYLAKFVGTLPWCLAFSGGGFVALCLAGGELGRQALALYWPAALAGTIAFAALFHLVGAVFRRPVVLGLAYVFFYEALVAALPGSLKLLSLTFYARSLMYNEATAAGYSAGMLDVNGAVSSPTAWAVLTAATIGLTCLGMWLFARNEYRDDV